MRDDFRLPAALLALVCAVLFTVGKWLIDAFWAWVGVY